MKIAVIGANGNSGQAFVGLALAEGNQVVAGVHRHQSLSVQDDLTLQSCDARNYDDVCRLVAGCDAVVSLVGHGWRSPKDVQTQTISNAVKAMEAEGVTRLISLTGTGVRCLDDKITLIDRIMNFSIKLIDSARIRDGISHYEYLTSTDGDWTVLRVLKLTNGPAQPYLLSTHGPAKTFVSRQTVARAIMDELRQPQFIRQAPIIANKL